MLDLQVVRAALKSYANLLKSKDTSNLSPSTSYLRLLVTANNTPPVPSDNAWQDPTTAILLLEWRAALLVRELAQNVQEPDASSPQRVAKAVTEAFVGARVGEIINGLPEALNGRERDVKVLGRLYLLVR